MLHCYIDIRSGERGADDPLIHFARILTQRFPHPVIPANRERGTKGRISSNKWLYNRGGRVAKTFCIVVCFFKQRFDHLNIVKT